ncbi:MAG: type II toxin-antitoxin system RelB/DinJ family antitoxin [Methylococcales bacterium]|nr:type II toxin-antitoxin system RelB/DinJ family antitoxin [Methylococcales bacterium]
MDTVITNPIQADTVKKAEQVLKRLGLNREQAIALFFEQIALQQDLPFSFNKPNAETLQAFKDSEQGDNLVECKDVDDLFNKLGI